MNNLPKIKTKVIEKAKMSDDMWELLFLFIDEYVKMINSDENIIREFNPSQHTLLAFNYLYGEVCNGGFIQLIQNGYGAYIFSSPFAETVKLWGAEKTASIVKRAKPIYDKYKERLETEVSMTDFSNLYSEITDFEPFEDEFYKIMDGDTKKINNYVLEHIHEFAEATL
ncbi:DMP19 family protein [Treponema pedis]|uniref:DMP19 family protein n=1 Tax=Treponema pedis TaxID=409322 RepID=UPI0019817847|nr:DMP19 family protein [Treponema pedis]QSI04603.1 DUF4375 domain-containing protein [Treponema pedis]